MLVEQPVLDLNMLLFSAGLLPSFSRATTALVGPSKKVVDAGRQVAAHILLDFWHILWDVLPQGLLQPGFSNTAGQVVELALACIRGEYSTKARSPSSSAGSSGSSSRKGGTTASSSTGRNAVIGRSRIRIALRVALRTCDHMVDKSFMPFTTVAAAVSEQFLDNLEPFELQLVQSDAMAQLVIIILGLLAQQLHTLQDGESPAMQTVPGALSDNGSKLRCNITREPCWSAAEVQPLSAMTVAACTY